MWSLRQKQDGEIYLTYDRFRYRSFNDPGLWEIVGPKNKFETTRFVEVNRAAGYLCCPDDEGNMRALVLTGEN